ncbi:hypothetical protein ACF1HU_14430 [Streptomyces olivaceus]|uniref:hypothetical protein n=1 Tax=Streptomyces olivaceus TaxID=47716 RepID=UPI0012FEE674|nr:hypothetical protein [Streptomyces olivaceus]MBZ6102005.1 hypothetical protein [Streptomyces olivaceus]
MPQDLRQRYGPAGAGPERTRMQVLAPATAALPQGPALSRAGTDLLRSKSLSATPTTGQEQRVGAAAGPGTFTVPGRTVAVFRRAG